MKSFIKEILLLIIIILIIGLYIERYYFYFNYDQKEEIVEEPLVKEDLNISKKQVDIKGEVVNPGVYEIKDGYIINDVIALAGGLKENADLSKINLSKKVNDEDVIYIYNKEEIKTENIKPIYNGPAPEEKNNLININKASKTELMKLNGIGEVKASSIIDYRNINGLFLNIEDIKKVTGISNNLYEKIKEFITV